MKKLNKSSWPVLIISDQLGQKNDSGYWLEKIIDQLKNAQYCSTILSSSYNDAYDIINSREDLGAILIEKDIKTTTLTKTNQQLLNYLAPNFKAKGNTTGSENIIDVIRARNKKIPVLLMTTRCSVEDISDSILSKINGTIWKFTDTPEFLSGNIARHVIDYATEVMPPFFTELVKYVNEYKYAWHTPGHMGGQGFLRSPSGTAFHKFFGEDVLRADLSISVPELGSLLDHSGVTGEAEKFSSKVFGSDQTYYVLNGTSTANQIIWRSVVSPEEKTLVDRNCHKSLNYAMVITNATPNYMIPLRNKMGIIGPVDFEKIPHLKDGAKYKMSALTNSTYDGVCYKVNEEKGYVIRKLGCAENWHFDEAWYAYAKFHKLYKNHFAMELEASSENRIVFATHSTHKLLTAFSQASMLHIKLPQVIGTAKDKEEANEFFKTKFNESYMMHGSTSPQYNMVASLEVASKMMYDNGEITFNEIITEAIELRRKIITIKEDQDKGSKSNWFFGLWQPTSIENSLKTLSIQDDLIKPEIWEIKPDETWHGFDFRKNVKKAYTMLDPIKLTLTCPGFDVINGLQENEQGIPAAIVTNYLIDKGIVCEKTDYYSFLLLNSIGTTKGKQGTLVAELLKFKQLYDTGALLSEVFPELVKKHSQYQNQTLEQHCTLMHKEISKKETSSSYNLIELMNKAFEEIPKQVKTPAEAYRSVVKNEVEYMNIEDIKSFLTQNGNEDEDIIAGVMLVPYPPGIPIMMGGESFKYVYKRYENKEMDERLNENYSILDYLKARQDFENKFPGYESDIHGIERTEADDEGNKYFKTLVLKA